MKFLCLGYLDSAQMDARSKKEIEAVMQQCQPHLEQLYQRGQVLIDAGLSPETKCLRRTNGEIQVMDVPLAEAGETMGSAFLIEARDMEEAIRIASLHPAVQVDAGEPFGWRIEIHPVHYFKSGE
ncbi:YciI family protein [uncultured Paenibacillus sp.]|uniref:YciI family protein n=1 Tax=uncultured Paenibacillus sp. TaxID=227322 RepID=UPI0015A7DCBF|nr:YciI family protein [uncultured Paenibacillus sp.]